MSAVGHHHLAAALPSVDSSAFCLWFCRLDAYLRDWVM